MGEQPKARSPRHWAIVPALLLAVTGTVLAVFWVPEEVPDVQQRNVRTAGTLLLATLALLSWFAFYAPLPFRTRALVVAGFLGAVGGLAALFRIDGVSGDLLPIVRFRWSAPAEARGEGPAPAAAAPAGATDVAFPQFLGTLRDGVAAAAPFSLDWAARPPRVLWKIEVGAGWSGFAVSHGRAVTQEQRGADERVLCLDLLTGKLLWSHADPVRFDHPLGGLGPRATPTIFGNRVYTLGSTGLLRCFELETGKLLWGADTARDAGVEVPEYGFSASPLVEGGHVIVQPEGLAAYGFESGKRAWGVPARKVAYASPLVAELGGHRHLVLLGFHSCSGHDPTSGKELWSYVWRGETPKAAQPLALDGDRLAISGGYDVGTDVFRVTQAAGAWKTEPVWTSKRLRSKFSNLVRHRGHLFGLSDGALTCVKEADGERTWRGSNYGHGQLLLAGDRILVSAESGELAVVDADPAAFRERARVPVLEGKTWNHPALAGPYLLMRNDRAAACLELPKGP